MLLGRGQIGQQFRYHIEANVFDLAAKLIMEKAAAEKNMLA
jgi:hypothetical protein